jgi:hypothetical protein
MMTAAKKGKMVRTLGEAERFFWLYDQVNCMNFAVYAELDKTISIERLERSLNELVLETPALQVKVETEGNRLYFVEENGSPLQVEPIQSGKEWKKTVLAEMSRPFLLCSWPMIRCLLLETADNKMITVVIFQHTVVDGRSGINFTKKLLRRALGEVSHCPTQNALLPAMESLFPDKQRGIGGKLRGNLFRLLEGFEWKKQGKPEQLPGYQTDIEPEREPCSFPLILEEELLTQLLAKAREEKTTLHGLIGAAQLLALREEFGDSESHAMTLTSLADMRDSLTQPVSAEVVALQITFLVTTHRVDEQASIWKLARDVRQQLRQKLIKGDGYHFWNSFPPPLFVPPNKKGANRLLKMTRLISPPSTLISNVGDVSDTKSELLSGVRSLSFLVCPSSITPINSTVNGWNGRLFINMNYDALKMAPARIERIAQAMQGYIVKALD